jgi:TolB-like protein
MATLGGWVFLRRNFEEPSYDSIAVLPFENLKWRSTTSLLFEGIISFTNPTL